MSSLVRSGGVRAAVLLFVVQRWDVSGMAVSRGDPVYRQAVLQALHNGVQVGGGTQKTPQTRGHRGSSTPTYGLWTWRFTG